MQKKTIQIVLTIEKMAAAPIPAIALEIINMIMVYIEL
jgi:hypothetical protein